MSEDAPPPPPTPPAPTPARGFSARALLTGLALCALFAALAPLNDWGVQNTFLYNSYLPLGVTLLAVVFGLVVNPLLGRRRFARGELALIIGMLLVLGGVVSSGLMRFWPAMVAGPAKVLPSAPGLAPLRAGDAGDGARWALPDGMFVGMPDEGRVAPNDPEYRVVVDGYWSGLGARGPARVAHRSQVTWVDSAGVQRTRIALGGTAARDARPGSFLDLDDPASGRPLLGLRPGDGLDTPSGRVTVLAVEPPEVPWDAWIEPLLAWSPLLLGAFLACIGLAGVVRRQWIEHERLTFPLAAVTLAFIDQAEPGRRFAPIFRRRGLWVGLGVTAVLLTWKGLGDMGWLSIPLSTTVDLTGAFAGDPWDKTWQPWFLFRPTVYFSAVALMFFLSLDLSFSLWFFFVATNVLYLVAHQAGYPLAWNSAPQANIGGFAIECLFIAWIGRSYYGRLLRAALGGRMQPELRAAVPYCRALLFGAALMAGYLVALGAWWTHALLVVLMFLGGMLVLARIVAEAGVGFVQNPTGFSLNQVVFSVVGFSAPLAALLPLTLIGLTLAADGRESLLPYAVNAEYLAERSGLQPRRRMLLTWLVTLAMGTLIAAAVMLAIAYHGNGHVDPYWHSVLVGQTLQPLADGHLVASQGGPSRTGDAWGAYGTGALLVAALGACRLQFAAFPLHPIGYLASTSYATWNIWFSCLLGWGIKLLVMRYGGSGLYQRLKPVAIGVIAGEALVAGLFLIGVFLARTFGAQVLVVPRFFPG